MTVVEIETNEFVGAFSIINGHGTLNVSKLHFLKYGMTAGIPLFGGTRVPPAQALTLAIYKAIGISCALDFSGPFLKRSHSYKNLDPTEQANISTWVGMAGAAFMADVNLGISQLIHAGALKQNGTLRTLDYRSRKLADFIGQDQNNNWHVLEAKARQNNPSNTDRAKWKNQAQTIATINGIKPITRSYCYTKINDPCIIELVDPPMRDNNQNNYYIDKEDIIETYYQVILDVLMDSEVRVNIENNPIRFTLAGFDPITKKYIHIGLHDEVYHKVKWKKIPPRVEPSGEIPLFTDFQENSKKLDIENSTDIEKNLFFMASDGVAVATTMNPDEIYNR
ncbi:MAG: hypothetical protein PWQ44_338 [Methanolobus sp.]|nr:hypothetical protein [Methanolobus sp.]